MITNLLTPEKIKFIDTVADGHTAVRLSAEPLLSQGFISESYIDAIFRSHA